VRTAAADAAGWCVAPQDAAARCVPPQATSPRRSILKKSATDHHYHHQQQQRLSRPAAPLCAQQVRDGAVLHGAQRSSAATKRVQFCV